MMNAPYLRTPAVPGGGFERPNPLIAGGPDPNAVIRIRDRLAAHAEALAPTTRWCVCPHLHHHALDAVIVRHAALRLSAFAGLRFLRRWLIANHPTRPSGESISPASGDVKASSNSGDTDQLPPSLSRYRRDDPKPDMEFAGVE